MNFSMNGFRERLSSDVSSLRNITSLIISEKHYDHEELVEVVDALIQHSNMLNCVYDSDNPDFKDMSDVYVEYLMEE